MSGLDSSKFVARVLALQIFTNSGDRHLVLNFSFASREAREEWKRLIEQSAGRCVLAYLEVDLAEIRRRVRARNAQSEKDADSAFNLMEEVLERFIGGFDFSTDVIRKPSIRNPP
ncbi:AAA family ATPase [Aspergillus tanneri]|uniref:Uncharacterized protein n=1 Tax=Aspergillus tanneri TaxID=1220188 RepID=A0A5M9MI72_9EURO|nr:uncharacterized protein ATNIH1004_011552 [Aspergillus tanneri]KAA8642607.1 hypothetical protein ATNIH1004_011552 [Aspergillus tanneri]